MAVEFVVRWYGVCDQCGEQDDEYRPTEAEAHDRMWIDDAGRELCWDCIDMQ